MRVIAKRLGAWIAGGLCAASMLGGSALAAPPNIVMIVADDHGRSALSAYGAKAISTPNLDAIARDGARFDNAFATAASCSPSRAVLLSGQQSHTNGMYGLQHGQNNFASFAGVKSLPVRLKALGYRTARIGKYHVAPASVYAFDENLSSLEEGDPTSRDPVKMAALAEPFVRASDEPFFLYFATADPHRGMAKVASGPNRFGNGEAGSGADYGQTFDPGKVEVPPYMNDTPEARAELAEYYQSVSRIDRGVGKLIAALKAAGKYENTVILYLSDNGEAFPGAKTTLYDPGIHMPLLMRAPGVRRPGGARQAMVSWVDITPTLIDYAGGGAERRRGEGRSFRRVLENGDEPGWDEVYGSQTFHEVQMYYPMRMVRTRTHKFIWNIASPLEFPFALDLFSSSTWQAFLKSGGARYGDRPRVNFLHRPPFELYDLRADPGETRNLAGDPAQAGLVEAFKVKLKAFQEETGDRWIRKWEYE